MWCAEGSTANVAVITEHGEQFTYADVMRATDELARHVSDRCLVFCLCRNCIGSLIGYIAFLSNGIVPLLVDAKTEKGGLSRLSDSYKPRFFWLPEEMLSDFPECAPVYSVHGYSLVRTPHPDGYPLFKDLALLMTTSGSTGGRKLVRQSYANLDANAESIVSYLELDASERSITTLPMNYSYGLSIINSHLRVGASLILTEKAVVQKEFWQQFDTYQATSFGGVPYTFELLHRLKFTRMKLPSLRTMTQAGGRLSPELQRHFGEFAEQSGRRFFVMYGQTEATARMSYLPGDRVLDKCGSIGIAIPGGSLSLIDNDGVGIVEHGVAGELVYTGSNVTLGYAEEGGDLTKDDEWKGRLHTGDIAEVDGDGFYWIVGRKKRFLKIYGNRVNLDEVEALLKEALDTSEVACAGFDDHLHVFVTDENLIDRAGRFIVDQTGLNRLAVFVSFIEAIPKNEAGKVLYSSLQRAVVPDE